MHCSIIGTCVNDDDLVRLMKKSGLRLSASAQSHEIHGLAVREAGNDGLFARALTKLLNRRFEGALRLMARAATADEATAIWASLRDSGQIAAGYWAVMSLAAVPMGVKKRVFGEVHMLSHLHGQGASQLASRLAAAERRIGELEGRLQRVEASKIEALAERDAARAEAAARADLQRPAAAGPVAGGGDVKLAKRLAKCERALVIARARARLAESGREEASRPGQLPGAARAIGCGPRDGQPDRAELAEARTPAPSRILYLGGRASVVPHLRAIARRHAADVVHHDGGVEDNPHRIGDLVSRCDAVVCPIDCVSHGACRMADLPSPQQAVRAHFDRKPKRFRSGARATSPGRRLCRRPRCRMRIGAAMATDRICASACTWHREHTVNLRVFEVGAIEMRVSQVRGGRTAWDSARTLAAAGTARPARASH